MDHIFCPTLFSWPARATALKGFRCRVKEVSLLLRCGFCCLPNERQTLSQYCFNVGVWRNVYCSYSEFCTLLMLIWSSNSRYCFCGWYAVAGLTKPDFLFLLLCFYFGKGVCCIRVVRLILFLSQQLPLPVTMLSRNIFLLHSFWNLDFLLRASFCSFSCQCYHQFVVASSIASAASSSRDTVSRHHASLPYHVLCLYLGLYNKVRIYPHRLNNHNFNADTNEFICWPELIYWLIFLDTIIV